MKKILQEGKVFMPAISNENSVTQYAMETLEPVTLIWDSICMVSADRGLIRSRCLYSARLRSPKRYRT